MYDLPYVQLSQYPAHYRVADHEGTAEAHDVHIVFDFPWSSQAVETITNYGDEPLAKLQLQANLSHQVTVLPYNVYE